MLTNLAPARGQRGSLPLTLLAVIMVTGLVLTLVATVIAGQRRQQVNRSYHEAITGAEAAVNQAVTFIGSLDGDDPRLTLTSADLPADAGDQLVVGRADFVWEARRLGPLAWVIRGTGSVNDVDRTLEVLASRDSTFYLAAFADIGFRMRGANDARSYTAAAVDTGNGAIGSNGTLDLVGNAYADAIYLMGPSATCDTNACDDDRMIGFPDPYDMEELERLIKQEMDAACEPGDFVPYTGGVLNGGTDYCFSSILTGNHQDVVLSHASSANPVRLFVTGNIEFGRHGEVNCGSGCSASQAPDAGALQVYSTGGNVRIGNQAAVAAAIGAPNATCAGNPSNAGAQIYGSIVCNDLSNQGGWDFWFDERLLNLGGGFFQIQVINEELTGTTSFPTATP